MDQTVLNKLSGKELKAKGLEMGLKLYDTKAEMKILDHLSKTEEALSSPPIESNCETENENELCLHLSTQDEEFTLKDVQINPESTISSNDRSSNESFEAGDNGANEKKRKRVNLV